MLQSITVGGITAPVLAASRRSPFLSKRLCQPSTALRTHATRHERRRLALPPLKPLAPRLVLRPRHLRSFYLSGPVRETLLSPTLTSSASIRSLYRVRLRRQSTLVKSPETVLDRSCNYADNTDYLCTKPPSRSRDIHLSAKYMHVSSSIRLPCVTIHIRLCIWLRVPLHCLGKPLQNIEAGSKVSLKRERGV
jgi:hypothetical protein